GIGCLVENVGQQYRAHRATLATFALLTGAGPPAIGTEVNEPVGRLERKVRTDRHGGAQDVWDFVFTLDRHCYAVSRVNDDHTLGLQRAGYVLAPRDLHARA